MQPFPGRFKHLRELYRLAQQRGWKASDPRGFDHVVEIAGMWRGRDVAILSGEDYMPCRCPLGKHHQWAANSRLRRGGSRHSVVDPAAS